MDRLRAKGKEHYEIAKRALSWIYWAGRPLLMAELREAIAVDPIEDIENGDDDCTDLDEESLTEPKIILDCCGSLVLWEHSTDVVGFAHYTVSEFFAVKADGNIEPEIYLGRTCLTYLCFDVFNEGECGEEQQFWIRTKKYRLASYIARFVGYHISESQVEETVQDLVLSILWSPPRRQVLLELDCNYESITSHFFERLPFYYRHCGSDEFYRGWRLLHFLSASGLAAISERLLAARSSDIEALLEDITRKWKRRPSIMSGSRTWDSNDLPLVTEPPLIAPLHLACRYGQVTFVELLLSQGAGVDIAYGTQCETPLYMAAIWGYERIVKLLLENGAEVNAQGGKCGNALQAAAALGHEGIVKLLLEKGAEVNAQGGYFGNALQAAAFKGHEGIVRLLLEKGAEVNAQGGDFGNALQAAAFRGHEGIVRLLLEKGAEVNAQGGGYGNALQAAAFRGHEGIVKLLLEYGATFGTSSVSTSTDGRG
jgi:ankyrin repeat protein